MKRKSTELDVDYIGGQDPMTKQEEIAITEFVKAQKLMRTQKQTRSTKTTPKRQISA